MSFVSENIDLFIVIVLLLFQESCFNLPGIVFKAKVTVQKKNSKFSIKGPYGLSFQFLMRCMWHMIVKTCLIITNH